MSGYPYGNSAGGGYPYYPPDNNHQPIPPPVPVYPSSQPYMPSYGFNPPPMPNNAYVQPPMPGYGFNAPSMPSNDYMPPPMSGNAYVPPPMSGNAYVPPSQSYEGYGNSQYQSSYPQEMTSSTSSGLYPTFPTTGTTSSYTGGGAAAAPSYQPQQHQSQQIYPEQTPSTLLASLEQYQGTVFPIANFNVDADCQALSTAMKGAGTDERALINIIANRSNAQRQQLKAHYKTIYGIDLVRQISGELSGHFRETVTGLFDAPATFDARSLHEALNAGKEGTLREILLTRTNSEIREIIEAHRRAYNKDLEKEISSRVRGGDFKRILISAVQANRDELTPQQIQQARQMGIESVIDRNRARQDAELLYKAGAGRLGTDEKTFNAIFAQRNYYHLRAVFEEYQKKYGKDITQVIRSEFSGDIRDAYFVLIACIRDRPSFFAERIHKAVDGLGTDDSTLIRVIITRSEIDLVQVKERYQQMYKRSLIQDVSGDTSGDYKRILLAIIK